jgi:signal transduction histidine kinase
VLRQTNAKLAEANAQADKVGRGKSLFLANVSHELRTSLNAILGFAEIMRSKTFKSDRGLCRRYLRFRRASSERHP